MMHRVFALGMRAGDFHPSMQLKCFLNAQRTTPTLSDSEIRVVCLSDSVQDAHTGTRGGQWTGMLVAGEMNKREKRKGATLTQKHNSETNNVLLDTIMIWTGSFVARA